MGLESYGAWMLSGDLQLRLLAERNNGTFARVYLAEALGAGGVRRLVAVKVLRERWSNDGNDFVARTLDEARMLAALRHPNIVRVEAVTEVEGSLALVMEYVHGVDLKQLIDKLRERGERLPPRVAYQIVGRVASALDAAWRKPPYGHQRPMQVVHRDVKPSNVMVTPDGELKVLDFGTARADFDGRAASTSVMRFGSLKYMSPERRNGTRGDHSDDIYGLGLVLMELLATGWLALLPEPPDHKDAVLRATAAIRDTAMPTDEWDRALLRVMRQMVADRSKERPSAEQVVRLMRAFADQASGPTLEDWASTTVGDLVEDVRSMPSQEPVALADAPPTAALPPAVPRGESRGTRGGGLPDGGEHTVPLAAPPMAGGHTIVPEMYEDDDLPTHDPLPRPPNLARPKPAPRAPAPPRPATPPPRAPAPPPRHAAPPPPPPATPGITPPPWTPSDDLGAETRIRPVPRTPAPPDDLNQAETMIRPTHDEPAAAPLQAKPAPPAPPAPVARGPVAQGPIASGPTPDDPPSDPPAPTPVKRRKPVLVLGAVLLIAFVLVGGGGGLLIGGWYLMNRQPDVVDIDPIDPIDVPAVPVEDPVDPPPAPSASGVAVSISVLDERIQWVKLQDAAGDTLGKSKAGTLSLDVEPGDYTLAAKVVGRSTAAMVVTVPEDGLDLSCWPQDEGPVLCGDPDLPDEATPLVAD